MNTNQTIIVNTRSNLYVKDQATTLTSEIGAVLGRAINKLVSYLVTIRELSIFRDREIPNEETIKRLESSEKEYSDGFVSPTFTSVEAMSEWLNSPSKVYKNGIRVNG